MTTSGTTAFIVSRDDIIKKALRLIGALGAGDSVTTEDNTNAAFALNILVKNWATKNYLLWLYQTASTTLVSGTQTYDIGPANGTGTFNVARPLRIAQAWVLDANNIRYPVTQLSRSDFQLLSPSNQAGAFPVNFYYDPKVLASSTATAVPNVGTISTWPVCNTTGYTLYISYERPIQDVATTSGASTENFDLPQEWYLPLAWQLAADLAPEYSVNLQKTSFLTAKAEKYLEDVVDWSREESSVYFTVDPQMSMRGTGGV